MIKKRMGMNIRPIMPTKENIYARICLIAIKEPGLKLYQQDYRVKVKIESICFASKSSKKNSVQIELYENYL